MSRFIQFIVVSYATVSLFGACTKKDPNRVDFESPIKFTYDEKLSKGDVIARVDGEDISVSQLLSPSPALQELEQRMNNIVLVAAYEQALAKSEKATLTLGFAEPKDDYKKILGAKVNKNIDVQFDANLGKNIYKINDESFKTDDIEAKNRLFAQLQVDSFKQKIKALEGIVARRKILQAAKAENVHMEEYIQKKILKSEIVVTDQEAIDYGKANNFVDADITDDLRAQLKDIVKGRRREQMIVDYASDHFVKTPIQIGFKKPAVKMSIPAVGEMAPQKGKGPIEIVMFSSVQCQDCKDVTQAVSDMVSSNEKYFKLSYVFNFPNNNNEERMVAEAAMCLKKQNVDYFWKLPGLLKKDDKTSVEESLDNAAKAMGANFEAYRSCFLSREFKDAVEAHVQGTKNLGFHRSPVLVMDGVVYESPVAADFLHTARDLRADKGLGFNFFYNLFR